MSEPESVNDLILRFTVDQNSLGLEELRAVAAELLQTTITDPLTGLLNRRGFEQRMAIEIERAKRDPDAHGVFVMIDLDGMKAVNDTYGHMVGDALLKKVADTLRDSVRPGDVAVRFGGDEFGVFLVNIDKDRGERRARSIQAKLERTTLGSEDIRVLAGDNAAKAEELKGIRIPIRASFGVAGYGANDTPQDVYSTADARMYAEKQARKAAAHQAQQPQTQLSRSTRRHGRRQAHQPQA